MLPRSDSLPQGGVSLLEKGNIPSPSLSALQVTLTLMFSSPKY